MEMIGKENLSTDLTCCSKQSSELLSVDHILQCIMVTSSLVRLLSLSESICLNASKVRGPLDTAKSSTSKITVALGGTGSVQLKGNKYLKVFNSPDQASILQWLIVMCYLNDRKCQDLFKNFQKEQKFVLFLMCWV